MKKTAAITIICSLISFKASANGAYVGVDYQHNDIGLSTKTISLVGSTFKPVADDYYESKSQKFPSVYFGYNVNENLAVEASYSYLKTKHTNYSEEFFPLPIDTKLQIHNIGFDVKPQINIDKFKIFGIAGVNLLRARAQEDASDGDEFGAKDQESNTALGYSIGAGGEFEFVKNLAFRTQIKYTKTNLKFKKTDFIESIDYIVAISAGLKYSF